MPVRVLLVACLAVALVCEGCAELPAYQRGKLAHPTMARGDAESLARAHVESLQEGAIGGTPGASSGCGCN